jgi:hypothetical protein
VSIIQVFNPSFFNVFEFFGIKGYSGDLYANRRTSIFGFVDFNEIGLSFLPLLSVLIGYKLYTHQKDYFIYMIMGSLISVLSNGRYIMIGFFVLSIQVLFAKKIKFTNILNYSISLIIITIVIGQALRIFNYDFQKWFESRLFMEGAITESTRYKAFLNFLVFFPKYMIWGTGVHLTEEIRLASQAIGSSQIHVGYLSHLVSYGLVGSIMLFGFWFYLIKDLYRSAKLTKYWGSFYAFLVYFWAQATLVSYSIFFTGLLFALIFNRFFQKRQENMQKNISFKYPT